MPLWAVSTRYRERTDGAFDVSIGALVKAWGFRDEKPRVPSETEIKAALTGVGPVAVEGRTVRLNEGTAVDPGAIGKGMAVDRAIEMLRAEGVTRAFVDFGSTARAIGTWEVPLRGGGRCRLTDRAIATSGGSEQAFKKDGKSYGHILDPRTGRPVEGVVEVHVVADTAAEADAMSTAIFVRKSLPDELPAVLVETGGEVRSNAAWREIHAKGRE